MARRRSPNRGLPLGWLAVAIAAMPVLGHAGEIIFHLKGGDRVTGVVMSETPEMVTLSNRWSQELKLPATEIVSRQEASESLQAQSTTTNTVLIADSVPVPPPPPIPPAGKWSGEWRLGMDVVYGAKDRQIFHTRFRLDFEKPRPLGPKRKFKNSFDFTAEYGTTDEVKSTDRLKASDKTSFDLVDDWYVYNLIGVGYDHIKKIDLQYEAGPGLGYRLIETPVFALNVEAGVNYQAQHRTGEADVRDFYYRLAEEITWKLNDRLNLIERFELFPRVNMNEFTLRFETTLSYELWKNLSLNLSVLDLYDSQPAQNVSRNELQVRSSIGLKF